jgi:hypothetical protein
MTSGQGKTHAHTDASLQVHEADDMTTDRAGHTETHAPGAAVECEPAVMRGLGVFPPEFQFGQQRSESSAAYSY